jgi:hypothetical protein
MSPFTLKATAHVSVLPASSTAWRASRTPSRATSIQCIAAPRPTRPAASSSAAARIAHVFVEMTSQPTST